MASEVQSSPVENGSSETDIDIWSRPPEQLYHWAVDFYKLEKDRLQMRYNDRVQLLAYFKQEKYGSYSSDKDSDVGYFDVVGRDRRMMWQALGEMDKTEVQKRFAQLMDSSSDHSFLAWVTQKIREEEEEERRRVAEAEALKRAQEEERRRQEEERRRREEEAERKRREEEEEKRLLEQQRQSEALSSEAPAQPEPKVGFETENTDGTSPHSDPPSLWSKPKAAAQLISELGTTGSHVLQVARSEMAVVKVDTSSSASGIFWEFCTEAYDIGFGVGFLMEGAGKEKEQELLPIVRRECSEDVITGTHTFSTPGTYLFKFDNTYSMFRSKKVFYRVYYCQQSQKQSDA